MLIHFWRFHLSLMMALVILLLAGCQPASQTMGQPATVVPTIALQAQPTHAVVAPIQESGDSPAYPAPTSAAPGQASYPAPDSGATGGGGDTSSTTGPGAYPAPGDVPGSGGVQVIENRSQITAQLISSAPSATSADATVLRVKILSSQDVEKMPNFTTGKENQEVDLLIKTANLPALQAGDKLQATVSYFGDEHGGYYQVLEIKKLDS